MNTESWWGKAVGKGPLGRQENRWNYNIKKGFRLMDCEDGRWMELTCRA
jgi:hypothetical protein